MNKKSSAYAAAGVDIDEKTAALKAVRRMLDSTARPGLVGGIGHFGGVFASPGREFVLVSSTDGVGTKLKVAAMAGRHDTVGADIVNHCVNDILVLGARPLFFLDYIGASRIDAAVLRQIMSGLCRACRANGCVLIGGETAEMPGLYPKGEYDLVGTIVGVAPRRRLITGSAVRAGDVIIGLRSSGLHTNGYSLARKVIFEKAGLGIADRLPGTHVSVGSALLAVHRSYLRPISAVIKKTRITAMAHITGGGFPDNIRRVLPPDVDAEVDARTWRVPALFRFIAEKGRVSTEEMYRVFNMGIGFVVFVRKRDAASAVAMLSRHGEKPVIIGRAAPGTGEVKMIF